MNEKGEKFEGLAQGRITLTVQSPAGPTESEPRNSTVSFDIRVQIIPRPLRQKRILWDQYHSLRYPPGYIPRDNLKMKADPLDWRADHIHTNFRDMYTHLRNAGYYVEVLGQSFTCFDASNYGTLLIVDPEEEFFDEEMEKVRADVLEKDLSVIVFADWYNTSVMRKIQFYDENTRQWWMPDTGGANIPALNELLGSFGILLGDQVSEGYFNMGDHGMYYASGASLIRFPQTNQSIVVERELFNQGTEILTGDQKNKVKTAVPILGMMQASMAEFVKHDLKSKAEHLLSDDRHSALDAVDVEPLNENALDKNPILNKRTLLGQKVNEVDSDPQAANKIDLDPKMPEPATNATDDVDALQKAKYSNSGHSTASHSSPPERKLKPREGRIVVYGDSNCLDSTHIEKPCFWLLDALLEFTMTSHVSSLLRELNRSSAIHFDQEKSVLPKRLPNNNLHLYSKVLNSAAPGSAANEVLHSKRDIPKCVNLNWEIPISVNVTAPNDLQLQNNKDRDDSDVDAVNSLYFRRKLESQKGEVRSDPH